MTTDSKTTWLGAVMAAAIAIGTYTQTGFDVKNPVWWCAMVAAVATALKGYYTNKA